MTDNVGLQQRISELDMNLGQSETARANLAQKSKEDASELATLRKGCLMQKKDIDDLERASSDLGDQMYRDRQGYLPNTRVVSICNHGLHSHCRIEADERLSARSRESDADKKCLLEQSELELRNQEELFMEERIKIRAELHEVTSNEVNLLNRIKCLEAEEGYSHAEVERILRRERDMEETQQQLQYRVESLEVELSKAHQTIEERKSQVSSKGLLVL
jgi:hypothetical protein